jgi:hypothetical protein
MRVLKLRVSMGINVLRACVCSTAVMNPTGRNNVT